MRFPLICLLALLFGTPTALAEGGGASAVREGRRLAQEARFDEALAAFTRAEAATDLEMSDLVDLLEGRALVHNAQGQDALFDQTVRALASVAPDYAPSRRIPPRLARRLRTTLESLGEVSSPTVRAEGARTASEVTVTTETAGDTAGLVRRLRVYVKVGAGSYVAHEGGEVRVAAGPTEAVRFYVEALGPGGVVLATLGSATSPEVLHVEELPPPSAVLPPPEETASVTPTSSGEEHTGSGAQTSAQTSAGQPADDDGIPIWPFVVGGVVLLVVATVLAVVLIPSSDTSPEIPGHPL